MSETLYRVLNDNPGGEYDVHILKQLPDGREEFMFRSQNEETVLAKGPFAGAPHGYRFLDNILAVANGKVGGRPFAREWNKVPLQDEEIRACFA